MKKMVTGVLIAVCVTGGMVFAHAQSLPQQPVSQIQCDNLADCQLKNQYDVAQESQLNAQYSQIQAAYGYRVSKLNGIISADNQYIAANTPANNAT